MAAYNKDGPENSNNHDKWALALRIEVDVKEMEEIFCCL
jgi:hypothetical protein